MSVAATADSSAADDFLHTLPKVELHVHLEGAIPAATLLALARRHSVRLPARTEAELLAWLEFRDFPHFAEVYARISRCLRTPKDIEQLAYDFLRGQAAQHVWHTEYTYTAWTHLKNYGLPYDEQFAALHQAGQRAARDFGVSSRIIVDIPRGYASAAEGLETARAAVEAQRYGVAALGLGGYEVGNPVSQYQEAFDLARAAGLPCVLHAGETEGAASIWEALRVGHSQRIGHGVRCLEDPALVDYLRARQVPLEVCPGSNVCLNVVPAYAAHPLPALLAQGLLVTLNSDDPALFSTSITEEYRRAHHELGLPLATLAQLAENALGASLLPAAEKEALRAKRFTSQATW